MRILVAEDEMTARCLLAGLLEDFGEVEEAEDGGQAVMMAHEAMEIGKPYQLICLDLTMPVVDGVQALSMIRKAEQALGHLPGMGAATILMVTASSDHRDILDAFREQADGYLVKPIQRSSLTQQLLKLGHTPVEARAAG